ncbi:hypothetical protein BJF90_28530 [Pseudonocardia sp. CNS-004]|nr:hypothetical protein BJF90_28530 [Pseudonocardia sp. CNS-004]
MGAELLGGADAVPSSREVGSAGAPGTGDGGFGGRIELTPLRRFLRVKTVPSSLAAAASSTSTAAATSPLLVRPT